jgi:hypothetical protein
MQYYRNVHLCGTHSIQVPIVKCGSVILRRIHEISVDMWSAAIATFIPNEYVQIN